jgi:hypothetical protein
MKKTIQRYVVISVDIEIDCEKIDYEVEEEVANIVLDDLYYEITFSGSVEIEQSGVLQAHVQIVGTEMVSMTTDNPL